MGDEDVAIPSRNVDLLLDHGAVFLACGPDDRYDYKETRT